ncbi:hypothetical protein C0991_010014, partial [Blastosporella zonata]
MAATHIPPQPVYFVASFNGATPRPAHVLQRRDREVYVHYVGTDDSLDEWVIGERCFIPSAPHANPSSTLLAHLRPTRSNDTGYSTVAEEFAQQHVAGPSSTAITRTGDTPEEIMAINGSVSTRSTSKKRKRGRPPFHSLSHQNRTNESVSASPAPTPVPEQDGETGTGIPAALRGEFNIEPHKQLRAPRNFENVHFGEWQVKTWYFSPYPLTDDLEETAPDTGGASKIAAQHSHKTTGRTRAEDVLAGGLGRGANANAGTENLKQLWVCQQCFKYMAEWSTYDVHARFCNADYPPGRRVYQRGAQSIWEVDGAQQKLYCQNLALFGKLFIDVKTLYFDLDNCYELSRRAGKVGTPERPLSDLGLRSYLAYWVSTLIRFFQSVLSVLPSNTLRITHVGRFPGIERTPSGESEPDSGSGSGSGSGAASSVENGNGRPLSTNRNSAQSGSTAPKKKKKAIGWAGEVQDGEQDWNDLPFDIIDPAFASYRKLVTECNEDGSATTHVVVNCTLVDIAHATNLRVDDAAFALNEVGLLVKRIAAGERTALD